MKKVFAILTVYILTASCSKTVVETDVNNSQFPLVVDCGNVVVNVTHDSWLKTKTSNADYYTISAVNTDSEPLIIEIKVDASGSGIVNHYYSDGTILASFIYDQNECLGMQFSELSENLTRGGGDRKKGERYLECVKRVYHEESEKIEANYEIFNDFLPAVADGIALYCAVVGCGEYE